jgi:hypothetical protein
MMWHSVCFFDDLTWIPAFAGMKGIGVQCGAASTNDGFREKRTAALVQKLAFPPPQSRHSQCSIPGNVPCTPIYSAIAFRRIGSGSTSSMEA